MRELRWISSSKKDLSDFPEDALREALFALEDACLGEKHPSAKPLKGFGGASVLEVVCDDRSGTYRAVYTTRIADAVYVLHAFQKRSTHGKETPKRHLDKIAARLKMAELDHAERLKRG